MDPLAASFAEWSPYNYVIGNPINFTDPTGLAPETIYKNKETDETVEVDDGIDRTIEVNASDFEEAKFFANEVKEGETQRDVAKAYQDFYLNHVSYNSFWGIFDGGPSMERMTGLTEFASSPFLVDVLTGPGKKRVGKHVAKKIVEKGGKYIFQNHHIIPKAIWKKYKKILEPFLRDGPFNLKKLPTPFHGNHPQYSKYVGKRLGEIIKVGNNKLSKKDMRAFQKELRSELQKAYNSGQKINDYFRGKN